MRTLALLLVYLMDKELDKQPYAGCFVFLHSSVQQRVVFLIVKCPNVLVWITWLYQAYGELYLMERAKASNLRKTGPPRLLQDTLLITDVHHAVIPSLFP